MTTAAVRAMQTATFFAGMQYRLGWRNGGFAKHWRWLLQQPGSIRPPDGEAHERYGRSSRRSRGQVALVAQRD